MYNLELKEIGVGERYFECDMVYDLESYPNCFTMTIIHASGKWLKTFEISDRKNQTSDIAKMSSLSH